MGTCHYDVSRSILKGEQTGRSHLAEVRRADFPVLGGLHLPSGDESLRDQIVSAALGLFREQGYQSTSLQDIITAAKCSKGGFYHHFASKEDLLYLIHESFITVALDRGEALRNRADTATNRLRQLIVYFVENVAEFRAHVTVFLEERRYLSSEKFAEIKQKREGIEHLVRELIEEGIVAGEFRSDIPSSIVAFAIFGMCNWTYQWLRPGGRLSAHEVGTQFADMILQGLMPPHRQEM